MSRSCGIMVECALAAFLRMKKPCKQAVEQSLVAHVVNIYILVIHVVLQIVLCGFCMLHLTS